VWCVYAHEGTLSQMRYEISEYPSGLSATSNVSCCVGYAHIHETNLCLWVSFSIQVSLFCIYVGLFWVVRPVDQGVCCRHAAFPHFPLLCTAAFLEGTKARLLAVVNFWAQALNPALLWVKRHCVPPHAHSTPSSFGFLQPWCLGNRYSRIW
jgi:hypothetical protein